MVKTRTRATEAAQQATSTGGSGKPEKPKKPTRSRHQDAKEEMLKPEMSTQSGETLNAGQPEPTSDRTKSDESRPPSKSKEAAVTKVKATGRKNAKVQPIQDQDLVIKSELEGADLKKEPDDEPGMDKKMKISQSKSDESVLSQRGDPASSEKLIDEPVSVKKEPEIPDVKAVTGAKTKRGRRNVGQEEVSQSHGTSDDKEKASVNESAPASKKKKLANENSEPAHSSDLVSKPKHDSMAGSSTGRPVSGKKFIGPHVSIAGGLWEAVHRITEYEGTSFGLFLRSQKTWNCKPLESDVAEKFKKALAESGISPWMVVPHGSYLLNCGSGDPVVVGKTREALVDELSRCDQLELPIYNFHPGAATGSISREECIETIAETINYAHSKTSKVITVIENMSGQGNTIGGKFSELRAIIDLVKDKSRMGVCLDTCHMFAAGYDIRSEDGYEAMKKEFDDVIGRHYLCAIHLNDSKAHRVWLENRSVKLGQRFVILGTKIARAMGVTSRITVCSCELGCNLDRHENIGRGKLGLPTFARIMNDPFFDDVPMVLETPECDYKKEIQLLYKQQQK